MRRSIILCLSLIVFVLAITLIFVLAFVPKYNDGGYNLRPSGSVESVTKILEEHSAEISVPCVDGVVKVLSGRKITTYITPAAKGKDTGVVLEADKGASLLLSFVSYSDIRNGGWRKTDIEKDGEEFSGYIKTRDLTKLYMSFIEQNELEAHFEEITGMKFSYFNCKKAIRSIDQQAFEQGLWNPADYPLDFDFVRNALIFGSLGLLLMDLVLSSVIIVIIENRRYNEYLRVWNEEGFEKWEELYGKLPQFQSLKNSGIRDEYRWIIKKRKVLEIIKDSLKN